MAIIQNAPMYSRQQTYRMLQGIPVSNHTAFYNVFQTAITLHATTYSWQQSYRMLQCIPDSNHTRCCNIL